MYSGFRLIFGLAGVLMILRGCYNFCLFAEVEHLWNILGGAFLLALSYLLARKG